ncbi:MAG: DciA family protein [Gemmataceae bacterium]
MTVPAPPPAPGGAGDGPENLGDILSKLFLARGWGRKTERQRLEHVWTTVAGAETAKDARPTSVRRGVLEIEVRNSVLLQELAQFRKRPLLAALRGQIPGVTITDIKFRRGAW